MLMGERIDEWLMSHLTEFNEKQFVSIAKGNLDLGDLEDEESKKAKKKQRKKLKAYWSERKQRLVTRL